MPKAEKTIQPLNHSTVQQNSIIPEQAGDEKPITCHPKVSEAQQCTMPKPNISCHPEFISGSQYIKIPQQVCDEKIINVKNLTS